MATCLTNYEDSNKIHPLLSQSYASKHSQTLKISQVTTTHSTPSTPPLLPPRPSTAPPTTTLDHAASPTTTLNRPLPTQLHSQPRHSPQFLNRTPSRASPPIRHQLESLHPRRFSGLQLMTGNKSSREFCNQVSQILDYTLDDIPNKPEKYLLVTKCESVSLALDAEIKVEVKNEGCGPVVSCLTRSVRLKAKNRV
ncbi:hypothetical protein RND81_07G120200 [Saponaria officinalis]|uniref:Uncharacterized protein n=1 Tax=Saponaria officinalis TaxID=3572 RepID=A0AAW1JU55_SAPOF